MRIYFHSLVLIFLLLSCSNPLGPDTTALSQEELLNLAYQNKSNGMLGEFFSRWQQEIQPISEQEFASQSEIEQTIHEIFEKFYDPRYPSKLGGSEWGDKLYQGHSYFIVHNKLYYRQVDEPGSENTLWFSSREEYEQFVATRDSIDNFRPRLDFSKTKVVYLTEKYESLLNDFLGRDLSQVGESNIANPAQAEGESQNRLQFLKKKANIIPGHWGFSWHILTHPEIRLIELDNNLQKAHIEFRIVYEGGYAKFEKEPQGWKMVDAKITWIE